MRHSLTVADALYGVARRLGVALVTGDHRLARAPGVDVDVVATRPAAHQRIHGRCKNMAHRGIITPRRARHGRRADRRDKGVAALESEAVVVGVADGVQEEIMDDWRVWPVCAAHGFGLRPELDEGQAVWMCHQGPHQGASFGSLR